MHWLYLSLFTKIVKWPGTRFWCTFLVSFLDENFPDIILYQLNKFKNITPFYFLFLKILYNLCFRIPVQIYNDLINFTILPQSTSPIGSVMNDTENKGKEKSTKIWVIWQLKELVRRNIKISQFFQSFCFGEIYVNKEHNL